MDAHRANGLSAQQLWSTSFIALVITQFLVALNDNIFRWLLVPIGKELIGQDLALWLGGAVFLMPFVLLAAPAGFMADRFSKRNVIVACKVAEVIIMLLGITAIMSGNVFFMFATLFLMGAQSAFFSPAKYGSIPELVSADKIAAANGVVTATTMIACIAGTALGPALYSLTTVPSILVVHPDPAVRASFKRPINELGYRFKESRTFSEALQTIRGGAPKVALLSEHLDDKGLADAVRELRLAAGGVQLVIMTENSSTQGVAEILEENVDRSLLTRFPVIEPLEKLKDPKVLAGVLGPGVEHGVEPERLASMLPGQYRIWLSALVLVGVALVGLLASLFIKPLPVGNAFARPPLNILASTWENLRVLYRHRAVFWAATASAYFWALGLLLQLTVDKLARPELVTEQFYVGVLLAILTLGIGAGAVVAGYISGGRIDLGLVPLGGLGIVVTCLAVFFLPHGTGHVWSTAFLWAAVWFFLMGCTAGLYDIPLQSYVQEYSPVEWRGRMLSAYNMMSFLGMFLLSCLFGVLTQGLGISARGIFLLIALVSLPVAIAAACAVPIDFIRVIVRGLAAMLYRIRVLGRENIPKDSGALLAPNHVTWIDWILLSLVCPRPIRYVAIPIYDFCSITRKLSRQFGVIPIEPGKRSSVLRAIKEAREALASGDIVCVFPEGGLSRSGHILPFMPGLLAIAKGTGCPVIPVYLGGLWGSIFSFERGRFFWKIPRRIPYPVWIIFGSPVYNARDALQLRQMVERLGVEKMPQQNDRRLILSREMLRMCRRNMGREKIVDTLGSRLTGSQLLLRTLIFRRLLRRDILAPDEQYVGVLLPSCAAAVLANAAIALDRRVAVNLNYSISSELINKCIHKAGICHVLTSRRVMERLNLNLDAELVFLEDLVEKVRTSDKLVAWFQTWVVPVWILERILKLTTLQPDDLLTVIFTSGSTGDPKGVMLTYRNIGSNVWAFNQVLRFRRDDVLIGILPFFHSFGYTVTVWTALTLDPKVAYHTNPLEARQVGKLCREERGTLFLATPTFLRHYLRRCEADDFRTLEVLIVGAEKLSPELADQFEQRFGVRPYEGYGATELSPVVSTNIPPSRIVASHQRVCKEGSVGLPLPGVAVKVTDLETGEELGPGQQGMLWVKGPNVMKGYLSEPEKTAEVIQNGWYKTGDIAELDEDGFIYIRGRWSRFSKIGGEMVPHELIEKALYEATQTSDDEPRIVVLGLPDQRKGERLVVAYAGVKLDPGQAVSALKERGLPPLWIPAPESFVELDNIPVTGSGKVALGEVKKMIEQKLQQK